MVLLNNVADCITMGEKEQKMLKVLIDKYALQPTNMRYRFVLQLGLGNNLPKVFIWCLKQHFDIDILCPENKTPLTFHCWTYEVGKDSFRQPRLVYDLHSNVILVQAIYRCSYKSPDTSSSKREYHSALPEMLASLPSRISQQFPLKQFYRSASSQNLLDYLILHSG